MMIDPEAVISVREFLQPAHFYKPAHAKIYAAMCAVSDSGEPVDLATTRTELERRAELDKVGGPAALIDIADSVLTSAYATSHAKIVLEKYILRKTAQYATKLAQSCYDAPGQVESLIESAQTNLSDIASEAQVGEGHSRNWDDLAPMVFDRLEDHIQTRAAHGKVGIHTGLSDLDRCLGGLRAGQLIVVGGRTSMGKTAFAVSAMLHIAYREKVPVAVFSLEMDDVDIGTRVLCAEANVCVKRVLSGETDQGELARLNSAQIRLCENMPLIVNRTENLTLPSLTARCAEYAAQGTKVVFLDYLQLMRGPSKAQNREQEIAAISRECKKIALTNHLVFVALSQLSREADKRTGKSENDRLPVLTDLRESGAIEQDADIVLFPWRKMEFNEHGLEVRQTNPMAAKVKVAKNRSGALGVVGVWFQPEPMRFVNATKEEEPYNGW